ncbi:MAG: ribonuclease HI [Chlorobi bacterium]|nr:ribonuclease HI [Chlorobiota bacterium]
MSDPNKRRIIIYTDGSAIGNPGPGGYGILMMWEDTPYQKTFSQGFRHTTNNRMELMAVVEALEKIKWPGQEVMVVTDSTYVSDAINKGWLENWKKKNFKGVKNADLWRRLVELMDRHRVRFWWTRGHNNHPQNEYCDKLARKAAKQPAHRLKADREYERINPPEKLL